MTGTEKFIVCKGSSGLGNRILAACTAILYSQIAGRQLIIDWRDGSYSDKGINAFPLFFEAPKIASLELLEDTASISPEVWVGELETSFSDMKEKLGVLEDEISLDLSKTQYSEDILIFCAYTNKIHKMRNLFTGEYAFLKEMEMPEILRFVLNSNFKLSPDIRQTVDTFKAQHFQGKTIGVHVRQTDMKIPVESLIEMTEKLAKGAQSQRIFLATDSQSVIQDFEKKFEVITYQKWFPPEGQRMHQNWDICPDRLQNGKEALTDLYLLSECDELVFSSQSSYGYVASLLSQAGKKRLHDITKPPLVERVKAKVKRLISER